MKRNDNIGIGFIAGVIYALIFIVVTILASVIEFWLAYYVGFIVKWTIGTPLCFSLNYIFATDRFIPEMIPWLCAGLGWVGLHFKSSNSSRREK